MRLSVGPDLDKAREDPGYFAKLLFGATRWQQDALRDVLTVRTLVFLWARQMGKSLCLATLALWWALRLPEQNVLIVSAGEDGAKRLLATAARLAAKSPLLAGSVVDENAGLLTLTNGSRIKAVPASERQIRGESVDLLLVDEAAMVSDDILLSAALPTTTARPNARIVVASTPWGHDSAFAAMAQTGHSNAEHTKTVRVVSKEAGGDFEASWITKEVLAAIKATMDEARFALEYQCDTSLSGSYVFSRPFLLNVTAPYDLFDFASLQSPARIALGFDWAAQGRDRNACVGWARFLVQRWNPDVKHPVFGIALAHTWEPGTLFATVIDEVVGSRAVYGAASYELNGVGAGPSQDLARLLPERHERQQEAGITEDPIVRNGVFTTAEVKARAISNLKMGFERGWLIGPRDEAWLRQMGGLKMELRASGAVSIEADTPTRHDDLVDATWLGLGPWSNGGRSGCLIPDLYRYGREEAEAARGVSRDVELVETGSGLRLPRRPWLQSIDGPEVTAPRAKPPIAPDPFASAKARVAQILNERKK